MAGVEASTVSTPTPLGGKFMPADARTIGDGDIIQATRQNTNPSGLTQFEITLPSGRKVESEWLREDQLKKALLPWIETIKAEMQADAEEVRAAARRAAAERRAPVLVSASGDALTAAPSASAAATASSLIASTSNTPAAPTSRTTVGALDPTEFLKQAVENAKREIRETEAAAQAAMAAWQKASANLKQWSDMLAAIGPKEVTNEGSIINIGSDLPKPRRGRPAGSRNRPKQTPAADGGV